MASSASSNPCGPSRLALEAHTGEWSQQLLAVLNAQKNVVLDWRVCDKLRKWSQSHLDELAPMLQQIWSNDEEPFARLAHVSSASCPMRRPAAREPG